MFLLRYAGVDNALRQFGARSDEADQAIARVDLYIHELQVGEVWLFEFIIY